MTTQYIHFQNNLSLEALPNLSRALTDAATDVSVSDICLVVSSGGGNVAAGIAIYDLLLAMPKPVEFQAMGNVDSIAITAMLGCEKRYSTPNTRFVFHPLGGGSIQNMTVKEGTQRLAALVHDQDRIKAIYRKRAGITGSELNQLFEGELFGDNAWAIKNGFISGERDFRYPAGARIFNAS